MDRWECSKCQNLLRGQKLLLRLIVKATENGAFSLIGGGVLVAQLISSDWLIR